MKKTISLLLAIIMLFAVISCSGSNSDGQSKRPESFDYELLSVGDTKLTYEYYRYLYNYIKKEYADNKTEITLDEINEQIVSKVKRDKAIRDLLSSFSQELTEEEITSCKEYIGLMQTSYGDAFETILEQQMKVSADVFTNITIMDYEYNKLYSFIADEKNNALDYSEAAISDYLKDFKAGMHIVILLSTHDDKDAEELIANIYTMALLDEAFEPLRSLHELGESMNTINESINKITEQIESGNTDSSLTSNLATLTKQLSTVSEQINKQLSELDIEATLDNYLEKLSEYKKYLMGFVNSSVNSDDASIVSLLDGELPALRNAIVSSIKDKIAQALSTNASSIANDKSAYGWISADIKNAISAFKEDSSLENANKITQIISNDTELGKDANIVVLSECFKAYSVMLSDESSMYDIYKALGTLDSNLKDIDIEKESNMVLYASAREAELEALSLKEIKENVFSALEGSYSKLSGIIVTFEELCIDYSDDYSEESKSVVYYFKSEALLPELGEAVKDMKEGEMSGIVKSTTGYHILKLTTPDVGYFKENEYPYYKLEDMISDRIEQIEVSNDNNFKALSEDQINEFEKEIASCLKTDSTSTAQPTDEPDNSNYLLITILVIAGTVAVVAVLIVLIVAAGKSEGNSNQKSKQTNTGNKKKKK